MSILAILPQDILASILIYWISSPCELLHLSNAITNRLLREASLQCLENGLRGLCLEHPIHIHSERRFIKLMHWVKKMNVDVGNLSLNNFYSTIIHDTFLLNYFPKVRKLCFKYSCRVDLGLLLNGGFPDLEVLSLMSISINASTHELLRKIPMKPTRIKHLTIQKSSIVTIQNVTAHTTLKYANSSIIEINGLFRWFLKHCPQLEYLEIENLGCLDLCILADICHQSLPCLHSISLGGFNLIWSNELQNTISLPQTHEITLRNVSFVCLKLLIMCCTAIQKLSLHISNVIAMDTDTTQQFTIWLSEYGHQLTSLEFRDTSVGYNNEEHYDDGNNNDYENGYDNSNMVIVDYLLTYSNCKLITLQLSHVKVSLFPLIHTCFHLHCLKLFNVTILSDDPSNPNHMFDSNNSSGFDHLQQVEIYCCKGIISTLFPFLFNSHNCTSLKITLVDDDEVENNQEETKKLMNIVFAPNPFTILSNLQHLTMRFPSSATTDIIQDNELLFLQELLLQHWYFPYPQLHTLTLILQIKSSLDFLLTTQMINKIVNECPLLKSLHFKINKYSELKQFEDPNAMRTLRSYMQLISK